MYRAMQEWNVLPEQITQESSKRRFKSLVKTYLLFKEVEKTKKQHWLRFNKIYVCFCNCEMCPERMKEMLCDDGISLHILKMCST